MKVLMTTDCIGGVWTYSLDLAASLEADGVEITLAVMGNRLNSQQWEQAGQVPSLTVLESDYRLEWMQEPWNDIAKAGEWLLDCERSIQPDIVHLNGYVHAALPWNSPVMIVAHSCVLSWWEAVKNERAPSEWSRYRREVARGLNAADLVVAPTQAMLNALMRHYAFSTPTAVIHNGRDSCLFNPGTKEPLIFSAGRVWDQAKNLKLLDQAAASLDWPVWVAGDTQAPDANTIQAKHVNTLGQLPPEKIAEYLRRASIYVLPARYEPFGLSVLEAAWSGCALVLGDIPSLRELWDGAAMFVDPDDVPELASAIQSCIQDPMLRAELGQLARKRASMYSLRRMAERYLSTYQILQHVGSCRSHQVGVV